MSSSDIDDDDEFMAQLLAQRCADAEKQHAATQPESKLTGELCCSSDQLSEAAALFRRAGVCVVERALPAELIQRCYTDYNCQRALLDEQLVRMGVDTTAHYAFNEVCSRGTNREDIRWGLCGPAFDDPLLNDQAPWAGLIEALLGEDATELWRGVVDNRPGSDCQPWHHDAQEGCAEGTCLTVFIPLVDLTMEKGPTQFLPGSQYGGGVELCRGDTPVGEFGTSPLLQRGDLVMFDYMVMHRGTSNVSDSNRPMMYIVYAKQGFNDKYNFPDDSPLW